MHMIKTLYIGSNWESLEILKTLKNDDRCEIVGIITQSDKPVGRKQILTPTAIKQYGVENGIEVFHTNSDENKYKEALEKFKPELIVCVAFGEIIPKFVLDYPKYNAINVHFSLLPKYRGAVPIQMAILNEDKKTGVTFVEMTEKLDAGLILEKFEVDIDSKDTNQTLREKLVNISKKELPDTLVKWINWEITGKEQDESKATYCYRRDIEKEKAEIKFDQMDSEKIDRMVRAFIPWPVAWTMLDGKRVKIYEVKIEQQKEEGKLIMKTKNGYIEILKLQPEGKSLMTSEEYLRGRK